MIVRKNKYLLQLVIALVAFSFLPLWSNTAFAQSPEGGVTPSFFQIAPCPTCSNPDVAPAGGTIVPSIEETSPSEGIVIPSVYTPGTNPAPCVDASLASDNAHGSRHRNHHGGVSNFMHQFLQLFIQLINMLLRLLGGSPIATPATPAPESSPAPLPCSGPTPRDIPVTSQVVPSIAVQQPSAAAPQPSGSVPSTAGTVATCNGSPITITQGGTYSGCYVSTNAGTPAVKIATTAPVTIDHATLLHAGRAIQSSVNGVQVTVTNSKFQATNPGAAAIQRAMQLNAPASLVAEHNLLVDGQGILVITGNPNTVRIRYNDVKNIGRYPHTDENGCCVQFVQFSQANVGDAEIAWNRDMNTYKQSDVEDNINLWKSSGTAAHPIDIHHNLISGAYPPSGNGSGFTGGGILAGDSGGNYVNIHDNRVVSTSNYGIAITGGHDNHIYNNHIINDGKADDGTPVGPSTASGISLWQYDPNAATGPNATAYNNTIGWLQPSGKQNDSYMPACNPANACINNTSMANPTATSEQAERDGWAADLRAAGLTVGPNW